MSDRNEFVTQIVTAMISKGMVELGAESPVDEVCKIYEKLYDCVQKCDHNSRQGSSFSVKAY